jgi:hypothetical protein
MKNTHFKATAFQKLLITTFILVIGGTAALFYMGLQTIREYAVEVTHTTEDATASAKQVEQLQALRQQLAQATSLVDKANQIYATPDNYQSLTISALQRYADTANVSISNTDFAPADEQSGETRKVTITFSNPVSFENLTRFLQLVEGSMPKMQVTKLIITRPTTPTGDSVTVDPIDINISVR